MSHTSGEYQFSEEDSSFGRVRIREKLYFSYLLHGFGIYLMFVEFVGIVLVEISLKNTVISDLRKSDKQSLSRLCSFFCPIPIIYNLNILITW